MHVLNYTFNRTGLKLSPCGVPTLLVNGLNVEVPFILVSMTVPLRRNLLVCVHLRQQLILLYPGDGDCILCQRPLKYQCRRF